MKRVAVVGGGPAGSIAAERLSRAGIDTYLLDEKLAWEKPCGGGVTFKAYHHYPFLLENGTPKRLVHRAVIGAPRTAPASLSLPQPICIYARRDLNQMLLDRAAASGVHIEKTRVLQLNREDGRWRIRTRHGELDADFCIVATGARNPLREVGTQLRPSDAMPALGYYIEAKRDHAEIEFLPSLEGYIWIFPRQNHLSAGICGKGEPAQRLRQRLEAYLRSKDIDYTGASFYSHLLPSLESTAWPGNRICGDGWLAAGDAAGFVDPITGEGIYYAIRSGDLAASLLASGSHAASAIPAAYRKLIAADFGDDLAFASTIARRVFLGRFLFEGIPTRTVQFVNRSPYFAGIVRDIFAGTQPYLTLKKRLLSNFWIIHKDAIVKFWLRKLARSQTDSPEYA